MAGPLAPDAASRFRRYRVVASILPVHLLLMEEPDGRLWWGCQFRTDIFRVAEAMELIKGVVADTVRLVKRDGEPVSKVLDR
jgi:hypothetical protein